MDFLFESRMVYAAATISVALSQTFFLAKSQRGNKVYLVRKSQTLADLGPDGDSMAGQAASRKRPLRRSHQVERMLVESKTNLPNIDLLLKRYYRISFVINFILALKYVAICLLDSRLMRNYRYLDCLLLGRISINGRTIGLAKYVGLCLLVFQVFYRFTMLFVRPSFNFASVEFLLMNPYELILWEAEERDNKIQGQREAMPASSFKEATSDTLCQQFDKQTVGFSTPSSPTLKSVKSTATGNKVLSGAVGQQGEHKYSTIMNYKNPFIMDGSFGHTGANHARLRPNRTFRAWRWISRFVVIYLLVTVSFYLMMLFPALRMLVPLFVTRPGFKMNYQYCVEWIAKQPNRADYSFIYSALAATNETAPGPIEVRRVSRVFMPLDDLVEFNSYHMIRIAIDLFENVLFFSEAVVSFSVFSLGPVICALDLLYYCREIDKQIQWVIARFSLNGSRQHNRPLVGSIEAHKSARNRDSFRSSKQQQQQQQQNERAEYRAQVLEIQAMIVDLFALISSYNLYAAFYTMFILIIWLIYSAVCSSWLFIPGNITETMKLEWYLLQALCSIIIFVVITSLNKVRVASAKLYRSIASLASIDIVSNKDGPNRWIGLMKHYSPMPLYCFTTFRSTEISHLLGFKTLVWLASGLLVASSLFAHPYSQY